MIVATRHLHIVDGQNPTGVSIRIYAPVASGGAWSCAYDIDWPEGRRTFAASGVDAVQALHLALQLIGFDLYRSEHHAAGRLVWETAGQGYGFPVPKDARDLLVGADKRFDG